MKSRKITFHRIIHYYVIYINDGIIIIEAILLGKGYKSVLSVQYTFELSVILGLL